MSLILPNTALYYLPLTFFKGIYFLTSSKLKIISLKSEISTTDLLPIFIFLIKILSIMLSFLATNAKFFYSIWLFILIVRFFLNMHIFWQTEKETASSLYSPIGTNFEGTILYLFTFRFDLLEEQSHTIQLTIN